MMDYDDKFRQMYEAKVKRIAELEAENKRLTGALRLIERSTGGCANGVAKAALGDDE